MTGASDKDMSVFNFDFNDCHKDWATDVSFRDKSSRNPKKAVTKSDFLNCFSRKSNMLHIETIDGLNSECEDNQQGEITENNAEEDTEILADYRVDHLISAGVSVDAAGNNDDGKQMTSTTPDHSGEQQVELISEDEGLSERRFPISNAMSDASDDEGASEHSYSDTSHNSDEYENMESQDMDILVIPEFGLFGDATFLVPRLTFSAEGIKLEIVNQKSSFDEVNAFQWSLNDVEYLKTYWIPVVGVTVAILDLKQGFNNELETFFRATGASVLFAFNDSSWLAQFRHIASLNDAYNTILKSLDWNICRDEDTLCEFLPRKLSFTSEDQDFGRFEETFGEFVFPKGDPDAVAISGRDIALLQPETFINDTLIDFYIKYLQTTISDKKRETCHFFNSFFFRKLADLDKAPDTEVVNRQAFQRVRKWTRRVNLFEKDYIFIPVNYSLHWSLIVICNPGAVLEDANHSKTPCILHMDSLGSHTSLRKLIQSYLWEEWRERHMEDEALFNTARERFSNMTFISVEAPQQDNCFDCGLFLLHYVEMFLRDAPAKFNLLELENKVCKFLKRDWFLPAEASLLKRFHIRRLIHQLYKELSGIGPALSYGASHRSYEAGQSDTGTSQDVECVLEDHARNQECSESLLLLDKVKEISACHMDEDTQISLSQTGKSVAMEGFEKDFGLVCGEYGRIETDNHSCDDEQFRSFHNDILSQQLKSTLSHALEDDNQSTQDLPSGSCTNQFSDVLHEFAINEHEKSEKETRYLCVPSGIQFGLLSNQQNPITNQLLGQEEEHPDSSSKRVLCKEGSESPILTAPESSFHVMMHSDCDKRPHKKQKALDDIVYDEENKMPSEENEKYATAMPSEENEKSASVLPSEDIEKYATVTDPKDADEMDISLEPRLDTYNLPHETQTSHPDETQVEGRNMVGKDSEDNASPNHVVQSLQHEKAGNTKSVSYDNDNSIALWKQKLKSSLAENLNLQDFASVNHHDAEGLEDPEKGMKNPFMSCQADQRSLGNDYDAGFESIDKCKHSSSMEDCARSAPDTPVNCVMVADDQICDDSISKNTENSNKCADSSGKISENEEKIVIREDVFESKSENEDARTLVADGNCTNSVSITNENIDKYVGTEGRTECPADFVDSTSTTPQKKQLFSLEGPAECLSSNDFTSPPQELLISRSRSRKTPSTIANGGNINSFKETPQVERPRTRSVTKNMDSAKLARENRRRKLSISNK